MRSVILVIFALFFYSYSASAQKGFYEKAYIIQNQDTLSGFIERQSEIDLSKRVKFKTSEASLTIKEYTPQELKGFGFYNDHIHFESVPAEIRKDTVVNHTQRFAKVLVLGAVNLYKLNLAMKERINIQKSDNTFIYVLKKGSSYYTLGQYEYRRDYKIGLNKRYIGILKANLNDCPQMVNKANNLEFDDKQVIKFITQYNLCVNPESTSKQLTYKVKKIIRPGIEASISKIVLFPETRKERGFSTGFFMDIHKPDISTKFFSSLGLNYRYLSVEVIDPDYDDRFSNTPTYVKESIQMIRFPILLNYSFKRIPNPKPVPFVSFGFTPMFVFGQDLETIGGGFVFNFGGGFYTNNLKFFLMLEHAGIPFVKDMNLKILNAGLGFTFNKKQ